jgi:hypothetical protein
VVDYYGLTPKEVRQDHIKSFQDDPKCRFFIGTPATGGYGITLTAANTVIYYSNGYDLERDYNQKIEHTGSDRKTSTLH